ncbi:SDR family NAD(P)-dependent oxidoreductase [bacterium]|nr:SDR family NAD(P)-dependent oxidoreductase [bacterium]
MRQDSQAIAITGIGCRFPGGVKDPDTFWKLLAEGRDAITDIPPDRWDIDTYYDPDRGKPGKAYVRKGGFIDDVSLFDPLFFGISPREASCMDPQQRLLLEVAWEALEDGGFSPQRLAGSRVGVFTGSFTHDFEHIHTQYSENHLHGPHSGTGIGISITANRLSYTFNFTGPSITIDTACSSSLVAVHLACRSLLDGESDIALAGGVNLIIDPQMTVVLCKGSFLSPDGHCKSFDDSADGYVRAEGAGLVVLKRLSRALEDGDAIYAVIRGSAVNQDGKSKGLTVPNAESQVKVIREALRKAGLGPSEIHYVEAHGTGTPVGDPIEAAALAEALTQERNGLECIIGSVKSNFGHTESAAGVAGLIKASLMLRHGLIPPNLHFNNPSRQIPFDKYKLRVPTTLEPWPRTDSGSRRIASVNSFGYGGTNAHVILESCEPSRGAAIQAGEEKLILVPLSAHHPQALTGLVRGLVDRLESGTPEGSALYDIGWTAALRREHHRYRLTVAAQTREELAANLKVFLEGGSRPGMASGQTLQPEAQRPVFVFSGMGQQWRGMGLRLYETEPVFRRTFDRCADIFKGLTREWSLLEELRVADEAGSRLAQPKVVQPMIFSLQAGLDALWRSWGIAPDTVIGHSVGEVAAACSVGILSLEDGALVTYHRGRLIQRLEGKGTMLAVGLSLEETGPLLEGLEGLVSVAAMNGPRSLTLSGDEKALGEIASRLEQKNEFARFVNVNVPYHSAALDSILDEFEKAIAGIAPRSGDAKMVSTVTGGVLDGATAGPSYWRDNIRKPVLFARGIGRLFETGHSLFVEVSAHPVLAVPLRECLETPGGRETAVIPSLRRDGDNRLQMYGALGQLYAAGYPLDWTRLYWSRGKVVRFPSYPWQRESLWMESEESLQRRLGHKTVRDNSDSHPLLGRRLDNSMPVWAVHVSRTKPAWIAEHTVQGNVVFPGSAFIEMAFAAARRLFGEDLFLVREVEISSPLILQDDSSVSLQLSVEEDYTFRINSRPPGAEAEWILHARGRLERMAQVTPPAPQNLGELKSRQKWYKSRQAAYADFRQHGLEYGPGFQAIEEAWITDSTALGCLKPPIGPGKESGGYLCHPTLLDACFQVMGLLFPSRGTYLPVWFESIRFYGSPGETAWCYASKTNSNRSRIRGDLLLTDGEGQPLVEIRGFHCQKMESSEEYTPELLDGILYEPVWVLDEKCARVRRLAGTGCLPAPERLAEKLGNVLPGLIERHGRAEYYSAVAPELDAICGLYAAEALERLGWNSGGAEPFAPKDLIARLGLPPQRSGLAGYLLEMMAGAGLLKKEGGYWCNAAAPGTRRAAEAWRDSLAKHPAWLAELTLIEQCGSHLDRMLTEEKALQSVAFYPDSALSEFLHQDSPSFTIYNRLLQLAVNTVVDSLPEGCPLRVLELGAEPGSLLRWVLPVLPPALARYVLTAQSQERLDKALARHRDNPLVGGQVLDLARDPGDQGFETGAFDLVLAGNPLSLSDDPRSALERAGSLLAPGGLLFLLETDRSARWLELILGFLHRGRRQSWDGGQPGIDLPELLESAGLSEVSPVSDREDACTPLQKILIARKPVPREPEPTADLDRPSGGQPAPGQPWVILADESGLAERLTALLRARGIQPVLIQAGRTEDFAGVFRTVCPDNSTAPVVVSLRGATDGLEKITSDSLEKTTNALCAETLHLVQALMQRDWAVNPALWMVTRGIENIGPRTGISLCQAPLLGLCHVIQAEFPKLHTRLIDLSPAPSPEQTRLLAEELLSPGKEDETGLRDGLLYRRRLIERKERDFFNPPTGDYRLFPIRSRGLNGLTLRDFSAAEPGPGEVQVEVRATGLNFKDVLMAGGVLDNAGIINWSARGVIGWEFSGVVRQTGPGVLDLSPGDEVIGLHYNSFSSALNVSQRTLVRKPQRMSFEAAAALPVVFGTAYYVLHELARIRKGDRVLIHSATGGLGLAAVQVARAAGAEVFATAGNHEKREFLQALGLKYAGDSRSLSFADEILDLTRGEGVDIILNTLPVESFPRNISTLRPVTGCIIDLSNVYERSLKMYDVSKGVSVHSFLLDNLLILHPEAFQGAFREFIGLFESGQFHALPYRTYPLSALQDAFKYMRSGKHIGKVVVSMDGSVTAPLPSRDRITAQKDATYLITGGLGGFGLAVARWLVSCGARHLVLAGRSGASRPGALEAVEELEKTGARVTVVRADITSRQAVGELLEQIRSTLPPLRGIVHAAMVLEDCPLLHMSAADMKKVLDPKILGAWNLHDGTLETKLDFFICFSSLAAICGNVDQANYAAANSFLDALMHCRRLAGLHGLSINWGVIEGAGYLDVQTELKDFLSRRGLGPVTLDQAFRAIAYALEKDLTQIVVSPVNWKKLSGYLPVIGTSPRFSLQWKADGEREKEADARLVGAIIAAEPAQRREMLADFLAGEVARILGIAKNSLERTRALDSVGIDSLMAVELVMAIESGLGMTMSKMLLARPGLTIDSLAETIEKELQKQSAQGENPQKAETIKNSGGELPVNVDEISDGDVDQILKTLLRLEGQKDG